MRIQNSTSSSAGAFAKEVERRFDSRSTVRDKDYLPSDKDLLPRRGDACVLAHPRSTAHRLDLATAETRVERGDVDGLESAETGVERVEADVMELASPETQIEKIEGDVQMATSEHLSELRDAVRIVPILWLVSSTFAVFVVGGSWAERMVRATFYGLVLSYPLLCVRLYRFARPAMKRGERMIALLVTGLAPLLVGLLAMGFRLIEYIWAELLVDWPQPDLITLTAKAVVVILSLLGLAVSAYGPRFERPVARWKTRFLLWASFSLAVLPALISSAVLFVVELILSALAVRSIINSRRDARAQKLRAMKILRSRLESGNEH